MMRGLQMRQFHQQEVVLRWGLCRWEAERLVDVLWQHQQE
jgi:hypothetical protein